MGYTTTFRGQIDLSRKLTMAEAKTLLELNDSDSNESAKTTGIKSYMQWVPTESLDAIVWDGNEKFYEYGPLMRWLCEWLAERSIFANGILMWSGEDGDAGQLIVTDNNLAVIDHNNPSRKQGKPLTLRRLREIALEQLVA